jgi:hypothetical protein
MTLAVQMDEATLPRRTDRHRGCGIEIWVLPVREFYTSSPTGRGTALFRRLVFMALWMGPGLALDSMQTLSTEMGSPYHHPHLSICSHLTCREVGYSNKYT